MAASFVGAVVSAVLLSRIDGDYARIIFTAAGRIGPAMVALGLIGAFLIDRINPGTRIAALVAAVVATLVAAGVAWVLMPADTRRLMRTTLTDRLGRG